MTINYFFPQISFTDSSSVMLAGWECIFALQGGQVAVVGGEHWPVSQAAALYHLTDQAMQHTNEKRGPALEDGGSTGWRRWMMYPVASEPAADDSTTSALAAPITRPLLSLVPCSSCWNAVLQLGTRAFLVGESWSNRAGLAPCFFLYQTPS